MSRARDYVPSNPYQFKAFMENLITIVTAKTTGSPPAWTHIPAERLQALVTKFGAFDTALTAFEANPTPGNRQRMQEAQAECVAELRPFVNQFLRFPPVTNPDRTDMHINNHDTVRTDHTVVLEEVENSVEPDGIRTLLVRFKVLGAAGNAKPEGYDGAVTIWHIGDEQPAAETAYEYHIMASRTPFRLHFGEEDRGKKVWIKQCWQNERGITGRWSEAVTAFVP